jgi:signal transduction histidine kinase
LAYYTWRYAWRATDLKVIYAELGKTTKLAEELEATREESKRKTFFLNAISHDLRTPLNGLMLQASLADLSAEAGDADGVRQAVRDMRASAKTTGDLLDSLLEYARLDWSTDPNNARPFRLYEAVEAAVEAHRPAAREKDIGLRNHCPPDLVLTTDRRSSSGCSATWSGTRSSSPRLAGYGRGRLRRHRGRGPRDRHRLRDRPGRARPAVRGVLPGTQP